MGAYVTINPTPSGDIVGSGTANYIAMFTSANVIGNSIIYQSVNASDATKTNLNVAGNLFLSPTASASGAVTPFTYTGPANTGQTASTEVYGAYWNMGSRQWATGNFATQREIYIAGPTYSFVASSTITNAYTLYITEPTAGTNAAFSNTWGLGVSGGVNITGRTNIGNYATPSAQRLVTIGQDTAYVSIGSMVGATSSAAIYFNQASPSNSNSSIFYNGNLNLNSTSGNYIYFSYTGTAHSSVNNLGWGFSALAIGSGAVTNFTFTVAANTGQTASTEIPNFKITGNTKTWAAGAITTQRWNYLTANTAAFASASTITASYGLYVEKAVAGSNATITNNFSLGTDGAISLGGALAFGTTTALASSSTTVQLASSGGWTQVITYTNGSNRLQIDGLTSSGATNSFTYSPPSNTGQTASTEISGFLYNSYTRTWAAGAITTQREQYIKTVTYAFASASTITNAYGLYVEKPTAGTNATITNNYALGLSGPIGLASSTLFSTAVAGAIEYNGEFFVTDGSGTRKSVLGKLYNQTTSVTVANTVTQTSLLTSTTTLPANFFTAGKQIVLRLRGFHSAVASPTIRIRVKLGATVVLDTGVVSSSNSTNTYFDIDGVICCRTTGASGTVMGQGFYLETGGGSNHFGMVNTAVITLDTTTTQVFDITVEWGTASASNTITATNGYIFIP